jgi:hypothetical protein
MLLPIPAETRANSLKFPLAGTDTDDWLLWPDSFTFSNISLRLWCKGTEKVFQ